MSGRAFICRGGPYDGRGITYPDPLPDMIVFADRRLHYHEYQRHSLRPNHRGRLTYQWERTYRMPAPAEQLNNPETPPWRSTSE